MKRRVHTTSSQSWRVDVPDKIKDDIRATCPVTQKIKFTGRKQALGYASWAKKMFDKEFNIYKCPHCKYLHVTTQDWREEIERKHYVEMAERLMARVCNTLSKDA